MNWRWSMYNSPDKCWDTDLTFLSYNQCLNHTFTADELLESDLWHVTSVDSNVYRCIPLFNCDSINSNNDSDKVLDTNKCLILVYDEDTRVQCKSDDMGGINYSSINLYAYTPYSKLNQTESLWVYCIVYDEFLNTLNNVLVDVLVDDELTSQVTTDGSGECRFRINTACTVQFKYNEILSNNIILTED